MMLFDARASFNLDHGLTYRVTFYHVMLVHLKPHAEYHLELFYLTSYYLPNLRHAASY